MYIRLVQDFGLECEVAKHLSEAYGDRAFTVAKMASLTGNKKVKNYKSECIILLFVSIF